MAPLWSDAWVGVIVAAFGALIAYTNFIYTRKKDRFNSLFQIFTYLNDDTHREARRVLYYYDKAIKSENEKEQGEDDPLEVSAIVMGFPDLANKREKLHRVSSDIVVNDFDQIGLMIKAGLDRKEEFLARYWKAVLACRYLLDDYVKDLRRRRKYDSYLEDFDFLRDNACIFAEERGFLEKLKDVKRDLLCSELSKKKK